MTSNASDTPGCITAKQAIADWLLRSASMRRADDCAMIGAEIGVKQAYLASVLLATDATLTLHLIDHYRIGSESYRQTGDPAACAPQLQHMAWFNEALSRLRPYSRRCVWHIGDSSTLARQLPMPPLHFVFIDADHSYNGRLADLHAWSPHILSGGFIAGGLWWSHYGGDCCERAVREFMRLQGWTCEIEHGPHQTWGFTKP